jgi:hypothetical protein
MRITNSSTFGHLLIGNGNNNNGMKNNIFLIITEDLDFFSKIKKIKIGVSVRGTGHLVANL